MEWYIIGPYWMLQRKRKEQNRGKRGESGPATNTKKREKLHKTPVVKGNGSNSLLDSFAPLISRKKGIRRKGGNTDIKGRKCSRNNRLLKCSIAFMSLSVSAKKKKLSRGFLGQRGGKKFVRREN